MASLAGIETDPAMIAHLLQGLKNMGRDEYILAFGPDGRQFIGTPNGYAATFLPSQIMTELNQGRVKKFLYVSFGDKSGSWFFVYENTANSVSLRLGEDAPTAVHQYINSIAKSPRNLATFRVQLGPAGSYVYWTEKEWRCFRVPDDLHRALRKASVPIVPNMKRGVPKATIEHITWHPNGSYYFRSDGYRNCSFQGPLMRAQWATLGKGEERELQHALRDLACVSINSFAPAHDTFVFIKKQVGDEEASFILHYHKEPVYIRLPTENDNGNTLQIHNPGETTIQRRWAISKKQGRPHRSDSWELSLKKGERVEILEDLGNEWYLVVGIKGIQGWCHGSWLACEAERLAPTARHAYKLFHEHCLAKLVPNEIREFPPIKDYANTCTRTECQPHKQDTGSIGICVHDLRSLLETSGSFNLPWIKAGRNIWHPDRFASFCVEERVEVLKPKAAKMFVLYSILMETM